MDSPYRLCCCVAIKNKYRNYRSYFQCFHWFDCLRSSYCFVDARKSQQFMEPSNPSIGAVMRWLPFSFCCCKTSNCRRSPGGTTLVPAEPSPGAAPTALAAQNVSSVGICRSELVGENKIESEKSVFFWWP